MSHIPDKAVRLRVNRARNLMQQVLQQPEFEPYADGCSFTATEYDIAYEQAETALRRISADLKAMNQREALLEYIVKQPEFQPFLNGSAPGQTAFSGDTLQRVAHLLSRLQDHLKANPAEPTFKPCRFEIDFEADPCTLITDPGTGNWKILQEAPSYLMLDGFQGEIVITVRVDTFRSPDDEERVAICVTRCTPDKYNTAVYNQQHWSQMEPPTNNPADWLTNVLNAFMTPGV